MILKPTDFYPPAAACRIVSASRDVPHPSMPISWHHTSPTHSHLECDDRLNTVEPHIHLFRWLKPIRVDHKSRCAIVCPEVTPLKQEALGYFLVATLDFA